jgi:hypothetical protein
MDIISSRWVVTDISDYSLPRMAILSFRNWSKRIIKNKTKLKLVV